MNFFKGLFKQPKANSNSSTLLNMGPQLVSPNWNMDDYNEEGYKKNLVAYASINMIAEACAEIPFLLFKKTRGSKTLPEEIINHDLLDLLDNPNPSQSGSDFIKYIISYYLIQGNTYVRGIAPTQNKPPRELWTLRPDQMTIKPGPFALPLGYVQKKGNLAQDIKFYESNPINGESEIMHWRSFNPNNDWYGMSPIEAAAFSIDQQNTGNKWNLGLLKNSARPSGAFIVKSEGGSRLTEDQRFDLKKQVTEQYTGAANTGKPILLEGGLDYREMGMSPKDMEFLNNKNTTARDVALTFGVPPQLIGIPGDNTFANYEQARLAFYQGTVLPLRKNLRRNLNSWLVKPFGDDLFLEDDKDSIEALAPIREMEWSRAQSATWLTINEKRQLTRYGAYEETDNPADMLFLPSGQLPISIAGDTSLDVAEPVSDSSDFQEQEEDESAPPKEDDEGKSIISFKNGKQFNIKSPAERRAFQLRQSRKRSRFESRFRAQLKAAFAFEKREVVDAIKDVPPNLLEFTINGVLEETQKNFEKVLANNLTSIMSSWGGEVLSIAKCCYLPMELKIDARESRLDHYIQEFVKAQSALRVKGISKATQRKLKSVIKNALAETEELSLPEVQEEIQKAVEDSYDNFTPSRSFTIAHTETHTASMDASLRAAQETDINGIQKTWISDLGPTARGMSDKDSTNHVSMDGETISVDEKFIVPSVDGDDMMDAPGDPTAPADQIINCKCVLTFNVPEEALI